MYEKLKSFIKEDQVFYTALLILIGVGSFGLGRQSLSENSSNQASVNESRVEITQTELPITIPTNDTSTVVVIASKSGKKYHLPTCPGAKQIKPANVIEFTTIAEAEAAGYTPAANCPGLQ